MRNLHLTLDCMYCSQKQGEDTAKFCGLLRIYELYMKSTGELLLFSKHVLIFCPSYSDVPNRRLCMFVTTVYY